MIDEPAREQHALELAFRYLNRRDRTVREVRRHLEAKGVEPAAADAAVASLIEQRYLDDERYAERFAEDRRTLDGWGAERIERRLAEVGVAAETIAGAVARPAEDELADAVALLRRRLGAAPDDARSRDRALGLLVRRGYELELAYDAIRALEREAA